MENKNELQQSTAKKVISIALNVLFYAFIAMLFIVSIANIKAKNTSDGEDRIPNVFGIGYAQVLSDSMVNPVDSSKTLFEKGDIIYVKIANEKRIEALEVGDIITFYDVNIDDTLSANGVTNSGQYSLNTHRIVDIKEESGEKVYYCQGDYLIGTANEYNNNYDDVSNFVQKVTEDDIKAVYVKTMGKGMTGFLSFIRSRLGFALCIVLPTAILLVFEAVILVLNIMKMNKEKLEAQMLASKEEQEKDLEAEKERMREELKAQLLKEMQEGKTPEAEQEEKSEEEKTE